MFISNERAIAIMRELRNDNTSHFSELAAACDKQLNIVIRKRGYGFYADWSVEDFCAEAIESVWKKCKTFDENEGSFSAWFGKVAQNIYFKHCDKQKRTVDTVPMITETEEGSEVNIIDLQVFTNSCEDEVMDRMASERAMEAVDNLSENQREAIRLCNFEGYKPAEAAKIMGCKPDDVYRYLNRAKAKLEKEAIKEDYLPDDFFER